MPQTGVVVIPDPDPLARALAAHRAGRLPEAVALYQALLAVDPHDPDALHGLGMVADAEGNPARAAELIGQALATRETARFRCNFALVLGRLGRHTEAVQNCERALSAYPDYPEALNNLGASLQALHRLVEAERAFRRAVAIRPAYAEAWGNLGNVLRSLGRTADAASAYEQAVAHNPLTPRMPLGQALRDLGRPTEAVAAFEADVGRAPDDPEALNNLGVGLLGLGRATEALACFERALAVRPDHPRVLANLGNALRGLGRLAESETALRRVVALRPTEVSDYDNLSITLQAQGRTHEALAVLDLAAALKPAHAETRSYRGMLLLSLGRLAEGWDDYEARFSIWQAGTDYARYAALPHWQGEPLQGRTILLLPEQGFGDTIQFARYAPLVKARGARVLLGAWKPLLPLMRSLPGVDAVVAAGQKAPPYDFHCPLLSLPRAFGTTLDTIPNQTPYLHPEPAAVARWATRLETGAPALRVGLVWAGSPRHLDDNRRSLPFAALAPLWAIPGVRWFSLQVGDRAADLGTDAALPASGIEDLAPELTDFAESAAALASLDLVITVDTAVAHLAGALGRPTWVLLARVPDWRWLRTGEKSPWYPTMRLFRQDDRRTWMPVCQAIADALRNLRQAAEKTKPPSSDRM